MSIMVTRRALGPPFVSVGVDFVTLDLVGRCASRTCSAKTWSIALPRGLPWQGPDRLLRLTDLLSMDLTDRSPRRLAR
jgi:hypothetical protein